MCPLGSADESLMWRKKHLNPYHPCDWHIIHSRTPDQTTLRPTGPGVWCVMEWGVSSGMRGCCCPIRTAREIGKCRPSQWNCLTRFQAGEPPRALLAGMVIRSAEVRGTKAATHGGAISVGTATTSFLEWPSQLCRFQKCWAIRRPGPRINIKTVFPRYGDSHVKDKTVGETVLSLTWESLYW